MEPKLYIIMRKDIQDMNPGKAMAQAAHAQADFGAYQSSLVNQDGDEFWQAMSAWREDREFGVTLVLHEPLEVINQIASVMPHSGVTVDPTYPWRNFYGDVFVSSEVTCAWVFVYTEEEVEYMKQFSLHR
jgi:peptidyl-tRNA hydrolase